METFRKYIFDGFELSVPVYYDKQSGKYIEDYREWFEKAVFTPSGHRIMFSGEDACEYGEGTDLECCRDCGSCRFYKRAGKHTWIGVCTNKSVCTGKKKANKIN